MDGYRIKVKIGEHEFEAEGPVEIVQNQFESFKELIANLPRQIGSGSKSSKQDEAAAAAGGEQLALDKICRVEGRVVSLTVRPEAEASAAMLIMLGQKSFRENETVTASEIKDGLEQSGYRTSRIDRMMQPLADEGSVIKIGVRKGTRYRFTNTGLTKAQTIARDALAQVT